MQNATDPGCPHWCATDHNHPSVFADEGVTIHQGRLRDGDGWRILGWRNDGLQPDPVTDYVLEVGEPGEPGDDVILPRDPERLRRLAAALAGLADRVATGALR